MAGRRRALPLAADGVPGNESLEHFTLKWAAYRVLTQELACPFALVEAGARTGLTGHRARWPRHDALGVRFRAGRSPEPWVDVAAISVRIEILDGASGRWQVLPADALQADSSGDPTVRAVELPEGGGETPLRAVAPGRTPGTVRIRRSGGARRELAQLCGADAKRTRGDLRAWLHDAPRRLRGVQLFMVVTPAGLCRAEELPAKVGLAEVDLDQLLDRDGLPAIRMARWPDALRPAARWAPERTAAFQRHAYYALHGLFGQQLFWFLAQRAMDRRRAADRPRAAPDPGVGEAAAAAADGAASRQEADRAAPGPGRAPRVRTYVPGDRQAVVDLWARTGIARPWNDLGWELDRHERRDPHLVLVAQAPDGRVAGAVMGAWDGRRGWVYHLAVDGPWRRQGVGRALLEEVERRLGDLGCPKIQLMVREEHAAVMEFYARCAYTRESVHVLSKSLAAPAAGGPRGRGG